MPIGKARLRISDYNRTRKAGIKKKERRITLVSLSLTSMVDMFAILVLYLLVNTGSVSQWLDLGHGIELPKAKASEMPMHGATLKVSNETLFGNDTALLSLNQIDRALPTISQLTQWFKDHPGEGGMVNILGDSRIPFGAMKRIVATCREAGFETVSLAIQPSK